MMNRRDVIKQGAIAAAGTFVAGRVNAQESGEAKQEWFHAGIVALNRQESARETKV